jgi:hypothetical protein
MNVLDETWSVEVVTGQGCPPAVYDPTPTPRPPEFWLDFGEREDVLVSTDGPFAKLVALAPQMARVLLANEWRGAQLDGRAYAAGCAECKNDEHEGHLAVCEMGKLCDQLRALQAGD